MRMRKKKNLLPRMEACGALLVADPRALRGRWRELLPDARELRVELGCGKGRFTAETAAAEPDVLLIAVEKVPDAMVVAMERARDAGLHNVFFVDGDAACLPDFFAPGEVDRIYINFCDPWPKSNQKKRRLTHGNFLQLYRRVLPMGGEIHFKSDNDKLFEWSLEEIPNSASGCPRSPGTSTPTAPWGL
ncbi:MAG: tRNA (guanosine(46)-N7)-methyltransferase TrmB [Oscillospiraceae bacterium]